jgi:methylmalonyl-CoA mutase cobalamin-binding subunit
MHTIYNARITLLATALNNMGVAAIVAGILAPLVKGEIVSSLAMATWLVVGLVSIIAAQATLGRLR